MPAQLRSSMRIERPGTGRMSRASRSRSLTTVLSSCLGVGVIFGMQPPLIALVLGRAGASSFAIGAVTAASLLAVIGLGPLYPRLIARVGLRACVVAGLGGSALVLTVMPMWPGVGSWLFLRLLTGCALGLGWIATEVWLNGIAGAARGAVMGLYGTVFAAGVMTGPLLLEVTGTRGHAPFLVGALCLFVTLLPPLLQRRIATPDPSFTPSHAMGAVLGGAPLIMGAAFIAGLVESADLTLLPLFGIHAGFAEHDALLLVSVFMAGNVVLQAPIGVLADLLGRRRMLAVCALLSGIGPLLLLPWLARPVLLWPLLFVWGGTLYAFYTLGVAVLGDAFSAAELPTANTVFVMVYCCGGIVGPSVGGLLLDAWPRLGLQSLLSGAAFCLLAGLLPGAAAAPGRRFD